MQMLTYFSANDDTAMGPSNSRPEAALGGGARAQSRLDSVAKDMLLTREDIKRSGLKRGEMDPCRRIREGCYVTGGSDISNSEGGCQSHLSCCVLIGARVRL
jgi:hypothetical protein